jgi:hypothetical protein
METLATMAKAAAKKVKRSRRPRNIGEDDEYEPSDSGEGQSSIPASSPSRERRSKNNQDRQHPNAMRPDMNDSNMKNRYLFRNDDYFARYQAIKDKKVANCYYYKQKGVIPQWEEAKIEQYLNHWRWRSLIEFNEPYNELLVKTFYAHLLVNQQTLELSSYVGGKEIKFTWRDIANILGETRSLDRYEQVYIFGVWPPPPEESLN